MSRIKGNLKERDTERRNGECGTDYLLAVGEPAAHRLLMLDEIFGPHSRELLGRVGLTRGMRVADIGCGTGLVSLWIAAELGAGGSVTGVDMSGEQLRVAEKNAVAAGLTNISFQEASAYENEPAPRAIRPGLFSVPYVPSYRPGECAEAAPAILAAGVVTQEELDTVCGGSMTPVKRG